MKDAHGNELHVGDEVYFRHARSSRWFLGIVRSLVSLSSGDEVRVDDGGPADKATSRYEYRNALVTTNPKLLRKVLPAVDPHETVTMISTHAETKEGTRP